MKQKDILLIIVPTFVVIVFWIIFSIYHSFISSTISQPLDTQIKPIAPTFDTKTLDDLKNRSRVDPVYDLSGNATSSANVSAEASPTPTPQTESLVGNSLESTQSANVSSQSGQTTKGL